MNIWLSVNNVPDLDLGCQDSYRMHLPHRPHHDPADHDFSLADSYPGSFSPLTIKNRHQKWEWLSTKKTKTSFVGTQSSRLLDVLHFVCVCHLLPSPSMSSSHASPRPSESVSLWSGLSTRTQLSHASPWLSLSLFSWFIFGVNQQLS